MAERGEESTGIYSLPVRYLMISPVTTLLSIYLVHVSPNQQHLVLLTASSRIVFIPFFERVIYRQVKLYDVAIDIQLGSPLVTSIYLAYGCEGNSRIAVVTVSHLRRFYINCCVENLIWTNRAAVYSFYILTSTAIRSPLCLRHLRLPRHPLATWR